MRNITFRNVEYMIRRVLELEQVGAIQILLFLLEKPLKMTELTELFQGSNTTIYRAVPKLRNLGLIEDKVTSYPVKRIFNLTEKGRKVAEKLREIEKLLEV